MLEKQNNTINSLAHTKWNCKYHIVFAPKYRRKVFFNEKRAEIREILRELCKWKGVDIIEGEVCPDHIHMLVSIPPKMNVASFMGYLKGKSSLMIFQRWGNMKFAYRNREFWCKGYYVDTVGKDTAAIKDYIAAQLENDLTSPSIATLVDLLNALGSNLSDFFHEETEPKVVFSQAEYIEKQSDT